MGCDQIEDSSLPRVGLNDNPVKTASVRIDCEGSGSKAVSIQARYWCKVDKLVENAKGQDGGHRKLLIILLKFIMLHEFVNYSPPKETCFEIYIQHFRLQIHVVFSITQLFNTFSTGFHSNPVLQSIQNQALWAN